MQIGLGNVNNKLCNTSCLVILKKTIQIFFVKEAALF